MLVSYKSRDCDCSHPPRVCSAGVGRTGAIIALDYLMAQAKAESVVDIYKCVEKMRQRRPHMIQTQVTPPFNPRSRGFCVWVQTTHTFANFLTALSILPSVSLCFGVTTPDLIV